MNAAAPAAMNQWHVAPHRGVLRRQRAHRSKCPLASHTLLVTVGRGHSSQAHTGTRASSNVPTSASIRYATPCSHLQNGVHQCKTPPLTPNPLFISPAAKHNPTQLLQYNHSLSWIPIVRTVITTGWPATIHESHICDDDGPSCSLSHLPPRETDTT
jgi:hypothetical protein